ncbi:hypothetical protein LTR20_009922 [Exophiala xenobiotica]|nr:hypothetical protein LTR92_007949 [Exophiala xenobiotica]KAK5379266.1 hypothetical protein LTS13_004158 [Exophiala xenobiotica]KAK5391891.1 hypothetical protein LTR79_010689 [Exophiala xenobiotica]KAK5411478.1 hypothetical protein LTR90_007852 [Exophiala xenobiotica]KAK5442755.1 hypothetical protein LTR18_005432 [Exophiala xenobiotica]
MGRLRKLSQSLKAAALGNHSNDSTQSFSRSASNGHTQVVDKDSPAASPNLTATAFSATPQTNPRTDRTPSRPTSMVYTPPSMEMGRDNHVGELVPVFSFLSSHSNKLYQEGYFLKLNDLDTQGRAYPDRNWTECFAQLVGTVLSLWDAAALDAAGQDGEVAPTFINLADASIKMIETLPTRNPEVAPLQNVLSISTAGKNRYLLHFNTLHSLTQWTAGIRLAMFEHASLHELYTGSLIAGKGKYLNNIRTIMEKSKFRTEDWARVRFGAGTPWRRCWCVIEPPDEKEWQKSNKSLKKKSAYERPSKPKGHIKFYDTKKTKKATPIATISDAYSAYAIYPQAKSLVDQSTLVKVEGRITIHSQPESKTEGFVFVMPELHAAVSGFEMMLRWLFPVYDTFHLYGRPQRLIADTWDTRGLMFAMPKERRYGYMDIIDVAALIHTQGSDKWSEREWRKQLKESTSRRMAMTVQSRSSSNLEGRGAGRTASESRPGLQYDDGASIRSTPSARHQYNQSTDAVFASPRKTATAPTNGPYLAPGQGHHRAVSESVTYLSPTKQRRQKENYQPSRLSTEFSEMEAIQPAPVPPNQRNGAFKNYAMVTEADSPVSGYSSDSDGQPQTNAEDVQADVRQLTPPAPVVAPPSFQHQAGDVPQKRPDARPDLRREKSRMSNATLSQMADVNKVVSGGAAGRAAMVAWNSGRQGEEDQGYPYRGVNSTPHDETEMSANQHASQAMVADGGAFTQSPADIRPEYPQFAHEQSMTQKPIARKPVPTPASNLLAPPTRSESPSNMSRYSASNYEYDNNSNDTPDYDSPPEDPNPSLLPRRRRTGVLRTVGDPSLGNTSNPSEHPPRINIPAVDFGTTYTPTLTPGHSRPAATANGILDVPSTSKLPHTAPATPQTRSPYDEKRISYIDSSGGRPSHSRSSSYAWHPGTVTGRQSPGGSLSAEEFVQLRAATARIPNGHVPHRSVSYSQLESSSKLQKKRDSPGRPSSRNSLLVDYSSHMTAREQEHVAKMTGGPLIQVGERSKTPDPSIGLIGAIEAREQEKRNMRQGVAGHMVKEAIAQRQAAERNYGYQQYPPYGYVMDSRQSGQGIYPQSPSPSPPSQMHQPWTDHQFYQNQSPAQMQQTQLLQRRQSQMDRSRLSGYYSSSGGYGTR